MPSSFICCIITSRRMKVPVRPTPALLADSVNEVDERHGILGHPMVWPGHVVELSDIQVTFARFRELEKRKLQCVNI